MKLSVILSIAVILLSGCASIPPDLLESYNIAQSTSIKMSERHFSAVNDLVENWYAERISRLDEIRKNEIGKVSFVVDHPKGSGKVKMIMEDDLKKIEEDYKEAMMQASKWKDSLNAGYLDKDNWQKLEKLNDVNLEWMRSFVGLYREQRKLFKELAKKNMPFPSDYINAQMKKIIQK